MARSPVPITQVAQVLLLWCSYVVYTICTGSHHVPVDGLGIQLIETEKSEA